MRLLQYMDGCLGMRWTWMPSCFGLSPKPGCESLTLRAAEMSHGPSQSKWFSVRRPTFALLILFALAPSQQVNLIVQPNSQDTRNFKKQAVGLILGFRSMVRWPSSGRSCFRMTTWGMVPPNPNFMLILGGFESWFPMHCGTCVKTGHPGYHGCKKWFLSSWWFLGF